MTQSAEALYQRRIVERQCYLDEAHRSSLLTIPAIIPDAEDICTRMDPVELQKPFQSLGARGTNNLASKLLLTLLPPTAPFMKYVLSEKTRDEAGEAATEISELQSLLARREAHIQTEVDLQGIRTKGFQILRHLLVAGNVLAYVDPAEGGLQLFPLNAFVVKRDGRGNLLDLIYVEKLDRTSIDDQRILNILADNPALSTPEKEEEPVLLYTRVQRTGKKAFKSWQELGEIVVEGTEETWTDEDLPWLALRYTSIDGEDYGRGFVEEYRGDLTGLEQISRDIQFASANAAKVVWAIDPTSSLKVKSFIEAKNGGAVAARADDVVAIRLDKGGDMQVALEERRELTQALSADFLLNSSFQRQQERVTAEEIRRMAEELEDTLGGVFSLLSQEFQLPLARLLEKQLVARGDLKALPKGTVRIGVVTGLAAIGRGQDLQRLREATTIITELAPVFPGLPDYIKESDLNLRVWTGTGVDTEGLLRTENEVAEQRQAAQQAAATQTLGEELARGAGNSVGGVDPTALAGSLNPQEN